MLIGDAKSNMSISLPVCCRSLDKSSFQTLTVYLYYVMNIYSL